MKRKIHENMKSGDKLVEARNEVVTMAEAYADAHDVFAMAKGGDSNSKFGSLIRAEQRMLAAVRRYRTIKLAAARGRKDRT